MSTPARFSFALVSIVLVAAAIVGCGKKEDEPVVLTMPSAAAIVPAKATQDPLPPPVAADSAAAPDPAAAVATAPPPADAPKAAPQSIEGCCSALSAMTKDAKLNPTIKSKAIAAAGMCSATAPLVKSGKGSRSTALTQIRATMAGSAPSACN